MVIRIHRGVERLDENGGRCGAQQVQRSSDEGLVCLEIDAGNTQESGVDQTEERCRKDDKEYHDEGRFRLAEAHHEGTAQGADDHDALKTEVDDTGVFRNAAAQGDKNQNRGENQRILNQQQHD